MFSVNTSSRRDESDGEVWLLRKVKEIVAGEVEEGARERMLSQQQQQGEGQDEGRFQFHNPFALRVGQVMTGFGIGCGVGIGVGRPLNISAVPMVGPIAGDAARSFGSVGHQVHDLIRKLGIKNLEVGIGCGVGLGHGFGIGVTLKPGAAQQLKHMVEQGLSALNERVRSVLGNSPVVDSQERVASISSGNSLVTEQKLPSGLLLGSTGTKQAGTLLGGLLQNTSPVAAIKTQSVPESQISRDSEVDRLQAENQILRTLLTHQEQIEELKKQNAALQQVLVEESNAPLEIAEGVHSDQKMKSKKYRAEIGGSKCFECRRRSRQRT